MSGRHYGNDPERLRKAVAATRECSICNRQVRASSLLPHENRHRVESQTKPCQECGTLIRRNSRSGQKQWDTKKYCSLKCLGRGEGNAARTPIEESYTVSPSGCWNWTRSIGADGYGKVRNPLQRGTTGAHRAVWMQLVGPVPEGMTLDHLCRNTRCVNPDHLEPVTLAENIRRAAAVRTTCRRGHPLDGRRVTKGREVRYCLTCHRQLEARRREARRVLAA